MAATANNKPWLPYVLPMGVYLAFLTVQSNANLAWLYPLKIIAVAATLLWFRRQYRELDGRRRLPVTHPCRREQRSATSPPEEGITEHDPLHRRGAGVGFPGHSALVSDPGRRVPVLPEMLAAVAIGLAAIVIWVGLDPFYLKLDQLLTLLERWLAVLWRGQTPPPPPTSALSGPFDPFTLASPTATWLFIGFRVFGAVVVVAFMEELFWRGFLIRWLIDEDFQKVPVGAFTWPSFAITVLMFGAEHNEWLPGLICGALYNGLLYWRRDLRGCVLAHAVSNAALAAWVLARGDWKFW